MKIHYAQLMHMRQAFVMRCALLNKDPKEADEYFTERAKKEGWIETVNATV